MRGRVCNHSDFLKLLKREELKEIFETKNGWEEVQNVFVKAKNSFGEDSWIEDFGGIIVNYITDGYTVNSLVFYFEKNKELCK